MNYNEFKNKVQRWPLISSRDLTRHEPNKQVIRNQLKRWRVKKLLIKLKRGVFILNTNDRKFTPSRGYIANQLYSPSYISLEYALNYYGLIPERVSDVTSITTKKTKCFRNEIGNFIYQHIKPGCFRGFKTLKDEAGLLFFIAEPEKALIDYLYFKTYHNKQFNPAEERLDKTIIARLSRKKLTKYASLYKINRKELYAYL